tara:strand:+ start:11779 stop:12426 length:648 start_codon:yes stop_codon:yes gene_type:complete
MKIFIPLKQNSQRVKRKNFRKFGEESLFKHTLLKYSQYDVYVDTDSDKICKLIASDDRLKNITVLMRKPTLRGDEVSVCDLIKSFIVDHAVECPVVQLHVTSPFLKKDTVIDALKYLDSYDSVVSCNMYQSRFWRKEGYGVCPVNHNPVKMEPTQVLPPLYEENSAFYIFKPNVILNMNSRIGSNPYFYPLESPQNIDIDTKSDWEYALQLNEII